MASRVIILMTGNTSPVFMVAPGSWCALYKQCESAQLQKLGSGLNQPWWLQEAKRVVKAAITTTTPVQVKNHWLDRVLTLRNPPSNPRKKLRRQSQPTLIYLDGNSCTIKETHSPLEASSWLVSSNLHIVATPPLVFPSWVSLYQTCTYCYPHYHAYCMWVGVLHESCVRAACSQVLEPTNTSEH